MLFRPICGGGMRSPGFEDRMGASWKPKAADRAAMDAPLPPEEGRLSGRIRVVDQPWRRPPAPHGCLQGRQRQHGVQMPRNGVAHHRFRAGIDFIDALHVKSEIPDGVAV